MLQTRTLRSQLSCLIQLKKCLINATHSFPLHFDIFIKVYEAETVMNVS
jgi:hypothetical protein